MTKVTLEVKDFKVLASETRLNILKALDGKKMGLKDISRVANLHEMTLHEHLEKLVETGFVKRHEREGHKWVYYSLSWKGISLIHPENTKIVFLFSTTIVTLIVGIVGLISIIQTIYTHVEPTNSIEDLIVISVDPFILGLTFTCFIIFTMSLTGMIHLSKKNN